MDQIEKLLKPELLLVGSALVYVFQVVWKVFNEAEALPAIPKWSIPLAIVLSGFGLAMREHAIHPVDPTITRLLADDWPIQGAFLVGVMLTAWLAVLAAFTDKSPPKSEAETPHSASMVSVLLGLALICLFVPSPASAQSMNYPPLDMHRANFGISGGARALGVEAAQVIGYPDKPLPYDGEIGAQFSYSTGPAIALVIGSDWGVGSHVGSVGEGISWALATDGVGSGLQLFARVRAVQYFGENAHLVASSSSSVDFALPVSWRVARNPSGKTAWYIGLVPVVDLKNPYRNSIAARLQLGWTPSPPQ